VSLVDVREAITQAHREEWARVVAALTKRFRDLDIAEEAAAEAFATAVQRWPADGVPLTPAQKAVSGSQPGYFDDIGWGFGMSVRTRRTHLGPWPVSYPPLASVGSYGWPGIYGTGWYNDPAEDMITILMIQRAPAPPGLPILLDFWTAAYQAIDD